MIKTKNIIVYSLTLVFTYIVAYFLDNQLFYTSFQGLNIGFDFNSLTFLASAMALFLCRRNKFIDQVISLPLIVLAFMAINLSTFIITSIAFLAIIKLDNLKFLAFVALNLIGLLIFKSDTNSLILLIAASSLLMIGVSKEKSVFLTLFLIKYFSLIDYGPAISSVASIIIPLGVLLLLWLFFKHYLSNSINVLSFFLVLLTPVLSAPVIITSLSLLGLSELINENRSRMQLVLTANIALLTIVLSLTYLSGQSQLLALVVLLSGFVEFAQRGQELNYAK